MPDASLYQALSQQQTLSPQMRKSLEILQAGTMELGQLIRQELELNPVLELTSDDLSLDAEGPEPEEIDGLEYLNETDDDWRDDGIYNNRGLNWTSDDEERRQHLYNSIVAPESLPQYLADQVDRSGLTPEVRAAAHALIGNLDERGFLDAPLGELSQRLDLSLPLLKNACKLLQTLDPPGVAAEDLRHSLLLQLERNGEGQSIEAKIVAHHLEDLARKRFPQIARALGTTLERIAEAAEHIGRLNPNPGGDFDGSRNPHILPDVIIERDENGRWCARLTDEYLPQLRINDAYKEMLARSGSAKEARQYLRDRLRDGRTLMQSIGLRQETVLAIAEKIVEHQPDFLAKGQRFLRPLTMNQVADELGLHPTTVSRAVAGKYIQTPHGVIDMRSFFATGYQTEGGEEVSNAGVREAIQQLISGENPAKPLSDDALAKKLAGQGITVARRTVAKYREQLHILPSHLRKSYAG